MFFDDDDDEHRLMCLTGPFTMPVDEEVESQHLKFIQNVPAGMSFADVVSRFNSNVSYSGLLHAVTADVCRVFSCLYSCGKVSK